MKQRIITALIMAVVLVPIVIIGDIPFVILGMCAAYGAGYELLNMFSVKYPALKKYRFIFPLFNSLLVLTNYFVLEGELDLSFYLFMIIATFICAMIICLKDSTLNMSAFGLFATVTVYSGVFISSLVSLRNVSSVAEVTDAKYMGAWLIVYLFASTMVTDMAAYFVGIKFGKKRLAPLISPKKSVEGAIGGSVVGTICGTLVLIAIENYYGVTFLKIDSQILNIIMIAVLSLAITIIGQIGDLVASKFKRDYGIKDYSNIFPGHGGILDRFDSLIATGTFMYIVFLFIGII